MGLDRAEIAAQLRDDITSGKYRVGDKLPSYRQLGRQLGAAPNTVGEAVRQLAAEGLVAVRQSTQAVVRSPDDPDETTDAKLERTHTELSALRTELRDARSQLSAAEKRVSGLLSDLER